MVEQRTIIDHKLWHILIHHNWCLDKREEYIIPPVEADGFYLAKIPNAYGHLPILVEKDTEIKVVFFNC